MGGDTEIRDREGAGTIRKKGDGEAGRRTGRGQWDCREGQSGSREGRAVSQ